MEKRELNYLHGILAVALGIIVLLFGGYIMIPIFGERASLYVCVPIALIGVAFSYFNKVKPKEVFPFALPPIKQFFGAILLSFGERMLSSSISVIVGLFFDSSKRGNAINSLVLKMSPFTAIIILAVLPAICEEFFSRGFLVKCFSKIKNEKLIILITSVIFGIMHLDPYSFFYTSIFGALLCYIALKTKSLLIPIFLHFARNAMSVWVTFSMTAEQDTAQVSELSMNLGQNISTILLCLALGAIPVFIGYRMFNGKKIKGKSLLAVIITSVIVFVGSFYFMMVSSFVNVDSGEDTIEYVDTIDQKILLNVEEKGTYLLSATFNCSDKVKISLMCGEEEIYSKNASGLVMVSTTFECNEDNLEYYIVVKNSEDDTDISGRLVYSYRVEKVNL